VAHPCAAAQLVEVCGFAIILGKAAEALLVKKTEIDL
jgi:hypothetical protein